MLLSHKTDIQLNTTESNIVGHMCYAASKLWNVCNYERRNFKELGMVHYPDWYDQKARLKGNMWFKSLPSQTAQEVSPLQHKSFFLPISRLPFIRSFISPFGVFCHSLLHLTP